MSRPAVIAWTAAVGLLLAIPAAAPAQADPQQMAADACRAEQHEIGRKSFRKRYGAKPMRKCLRAARKEVAAATSVATGDCYAELDEYGLEEFLYDYGPDFATAFARCTAEGLDLELGSYFPLLTDILLD